MQALEAAALRKIDAFEAQAVATILHIIAKTRYSPRNQSLLSQLEGRAEALAAGTFNAQDVANTLWACATMGRKRGAGVMRELEGRTEALAGTFNAQDVANTLWAYATMGREPGEGVMRGLEGRAEELAGTFNAQGLANTLWAYAKIGWEPGTVLRCRLEERILEVVAEYTSQGIAATRWACSQLRMSLPAEVETRFTARQSAILLRESNEHASTSARGRGGMEGENAGRGTETSRSMSRSRSRSRSRARERMGEGLRAGAAHVPGGIFIRGLPLDVTCGELEMCFHRYSKVLIATCKRAAFQQVAYVKISSPQVADELLRGVYGQLRLFTRGLGSRV